MASIYEKFRNLHSKLEIIEDPQFKARQEALRYVQKKLDIRTILYPGPQSDNLTDAFPITLYLDVDNTCLENLSEINKKIGRQDQFVLGTYTDIPFVRKGIDALFYRDPDNMLNDEEIPDKKAAVNSSVEMFETVKDDGFIIYDDYFDLECPFNIGVTVLDKTSGLKRLNTNPPKKYPHLYVFQKTKEFQISQFAQNVELAFVSKEDKMNRKLYGFLTFKGV